MIKRRNLLGLLLGGGAATTLWSRAGQGQVGERSVSSRGLGAIDPYFLDPGQMTSDEASAQVQLEQVNAKRMVGEQAVVPRGVTSRRAPTYRFVHWQGELNDPDGKFVSPLQVKSGLPRGKAYRLNAQVLGFRGASDDWGKRYNQGTLTVELRGRVRDESVTWLFAQQFDVDERGFSNLGYEYVAQREGAPVPVVTSEPNLGLRIQLMRHPKKASRLTKFLKVALVVTGIPVSVDDSEISNTLQALPPMRVPAMLPEGVALSQALFGGTADETPIWRGGFSSYGLGAGGSQLGIAPGYWMVIDGSRESDLRGVVLSDVGGRIMPVRGGEPLDANYLILSVELGLGELPDFLQLDDISDFDVGDEPIRKGAPPLDDR